MARNRASWKGDWEEIGISGAGTAFETSVYIMPSRAGSLQVVPTDNETT